LEPEGFTEDPKGPLHLWFNLAGNEEVLTDRAFFHGKKFGLGTDVSFGTGASNSVTSVVDLTNGKKVALWKDPRTPPDAFAAETVALAKWFNNGFLAWDASGPSGKAFTKPVVGYKYPNIYYRRDEETTRQRISRQPGYFLNPEDRMVLLQDYRTALADRVFINPSEEGLMETLQFIVKPGGGVEHASAANSQNPTGARGAHGDEVIADALASRLPGFCPHELKTQTLKAPWMSPQWRLEQEEIALAMAEQSDW